MDMVRHPAIRKHFPATASDFVLKPSCESIIVNIVVEDLASAIATSHNMYIA
jgi:hypothetical protein